MTRMNSWHISMPCGQVCRWMNNTAEADLLGNSAADYLEKNGLIFLYLSDKIENYNFVAI